MNRSNKDMMRYELMDGKYVIKTPEDALESKTEDALKTDLYIPPYGSHQLNEIRDFSVSEAGYKVGYHYSDVGMETFLIVKGSVEVVLNGKKFVLTKGDIMNVEAWCPYSMTFLEAGTVVREMCTDRNNNEFDMLPPACCEDADKTKLNDVTCSDKGIYEFKTEGIKFLLKVGRWQLGGYKEIWEVQLDKDHKLTYNGDIACEGLYSVKSGQFIVEVDGKEFMAGPDDLIHIPANSPYALTAASEDCAITDFNVSSHLFRLLEMIEAAQDYFPEKLADSAYMDYLFTANNSAKFKSLDAV